MSRKVLIYSKLFCIGVIVVVYVFVYVLSLSFGVIRCVCFHAGHVCLPVSVSVYECVYGTVRVSQSGHSWSHANGLCPLLKQLTARRTAI